MFEHILHRYNFYRDVETQDFPEENKILTKLVHLTSDERVGLVFDRLSMIDNANCNASPAWIPFLHGRLWRLELICQQANRSKNVSKSPELQSSEEIPAESLTFVTANASYSYCFFIFVNVIANTLNPTIIQLIVTWKCDENGNKMMVEMQTSKTLLMFKARAIKYVSFGLTNIHRRRYIMTIAQDAIPLASEDNWQNHLSWYVSSWQPLWRMLLKLSRRHYVTRCIRHLVAKKLNYLILNWIKKL